MFFNCKNLKTVKFLNDDGIAENHGLGGLTDGSYMFAHSGIESFNYFTPRLVNSVEMFYNCTALTSAVVDSPLPTGQYGSEI
jgi:hypothetical protein